MRRLENLHGFRGSHKGSETQIHTLGCVKQVSVSEKLISNLQ